MDIMVEEAEKKPSLPVLYPWQEEAKAKWFERGRRGIVKVATGAGKTFFALSICESMDEDCRIKIVVPTIPIAKQWKTTIESYDLKGDVGLWYGDKHSGGDCRYMIYVVDSARYAISGHILRNMQQGKKVLLICDECQHYGSKENQKIFHFHEARGYADSLYMSLGLSATPECSNFETVIKPRLGDVFFDLTMAEAQAQRIVNPYFLFQIALSFSSSESLDYIDLCDRITTLYSRIRNTHLELRAYDGEAFLDAVRKRADAGDDECAAYINLLFQRSQLVANASARIDCAAALIDSLSKKSRIIVFSERIEQAEELYRRIVKTGSVRARLYHSFLSDAAKKVALSDFRDGEARILVSCKCLDEGLNVPDADVGIVLSSTHSDRQRIQRLGRILRAKEGKEPARLYYLYVASTNDPFVYLGNNESASAVGNLIYGEEGFDYEDYLVLAEQLLSSLPSSNDEERMAKRQTRRHIETGLTRGDFLLSVERLREYESEASNNEEKAYFHTMLLLSKMRNADSDSPKAPARI